MNLPNDIKIRFFSSIVLLSVVLFSLIKGGIYFTFFLIIASLFMIFEWMRLISKSFWIIRGLIASLGFDHRLIDGAGGSNFLKEIKKNIESMNLKDLV